MFSAEPTRTTSAFPTFRVATLHLPRRRVNPFHVETQHSHARDIRALAATDIEPSSADLAAADHVAHQAGLRLEEREPARLGNLHVVGVGDIVEMGFAARARRAQMDHDKQRAQRHRHPDRGQPDAKDRQGGGRFADAVCREHRQHVRTGNQDATRRQQHAPDNGRVGIRQFGGRHVERGAPLTRQQPETQSRQQPRREARRDTGPPGLAARQAIERRDRGFDRTDARSAPGRRPAPVRLRHLHLRFSHLLKVSRGNVPDEQPDSTTMTTSSSSSVKPRARLRSRSTRPARPRAMHVCALDRSFAALRNPRSARSPCTIEPKKEDRAFGERARTAGLSLE